MCLIPLHGNYKHIAINMEYRYASQRERDNVPKDKIFMTHISWFRSFEKFNKDFKRHYS